MTKLQFQDYLSNEPVISDLIDLLAESPVDDFDNEWFIGALKSSVDADNLSVLMSPCGDFWLRSSTIPNDSYDYFFGERCTIYHLT